MSFLALSEKLDEVPVSRNSRLARWGLALEFYYIQKLQLLYSFWQAHTPH